MVRRNELCQDKRVIDSFVINFKPIESKIHPKPMQISLLSRAQRAPFRALRSATSSAWLLFCLLVVSSVSARAATFVVTSSADTDGAACGTDCTLRQALNAANGASGDDIITFASAVTGTITLTGGELPISSNVSINGPGAGVLSVSGNNASRVFNIASGTVLIDGLTIRNGNAAPPRSNFEDPAFYGGGIFNSGTLTLSNSTLSNNSGSQAGAIFNNNGGTLTLSNSTLSNNTSNDNDAGGLLNSGTAVVSNCTLSDNRADFGTGGGIRSDGMLTLSNSTLSNNRSSSGGGGIESGGTTTISNSTLSGNSTANGGGGIFSGGTTTISNSTLSGNRAYNGGGIFINSGTVNVINSTLSGNTAYSGEGGGGIFNIDTLNVSNSTLSGNTGSTAGGIFAYYGAVNLDNSLVVGNGTDISGDFTDNGHNLTGMTAAQAGLQTDTSGNAVLADNGGPTQTIALLAGSAAIDAGNSALTTDQRGVRRPVDIAGVANVGNGSDIGAYELDAAQTGSNLVVNQTDDHDDGVCGAGDCTLREAINAASGNGAAQNNITFDATVFASKQTIKLSQGLLPLINTDILITGPTASGAGVTVDAGGNSRIFGVIGGTSTFSNLTLSGGNINGDDGGAIKQGGASVLTLNNCTLSGNMATVSGGAIATNAMLTLNSCTLSGNTAIFGGGIHSSGTLTLNSCTLSDNSTSGNGGANMGGGILSEGTLTLNSCTLSGNRAGNGGGVFINSGTFNSSNTIVAGNTAPTNPDVSGTITAGDYNLIGNKQGAFFPASASHNITDVDPKLGPLKDNGGPTLTLALQTGSPAIDAGNTPFTSDQRGRVRPFDFAGVANAAGGNGSDIGAFELNETPQSGSNFVVNKTDDHDDGVCGPTDCTLREAINAANANADSNTITFDATVFAARQTLATQTAFPDLTSNISISGPTAPGAGVTLSQPNGGSGALLVSGGTVNLTNLTFNSGSNGYGLQNSNNGNGGGGSLTLRGCTFAGNFIGLVFNSGTTTVSNCTFSGNTNLGIEALSNFTLDSSTLSGNDTGLIVASGTSTVSNTIIAGNSSNVYNSGGTLNDAGHNILTGTATMAGLGPIADNGGPTQTFALLAGSPAINAGDPNFNGAGLFDQRGPGFARVLRGRLDIGAFESPFPNHAPVLNNRTFTTATNAPFSQQLTATDADGDALTYTLASGTTLPAGLRLTRRGQISGTPTMAGRTDFSVAVSDGIATTNARFIIIVSNASDGVGPVITRSAVSSPTTRDALARTSLSGTIHDIAQRGVTPSGVSRLLVQLRDSNGNAYSGSSDGFTSNVNRGYYAATLGAPRGGTTSGARTYSRDLSWIPADLAPGDYTLNIAGQDVAGNNSVEVVPITIFAATATSSVSAMRAPAASGSGGNS